MTDATILVCDDDPAILDLVGTLLKSRGYRVLKAASGREALAKAAAERPQAIVLDLLMPRMSGWRTAEALKENPDTAATPIVILSVVSRPENRIAADPATRDAVDWLHKPVHAPTLFRAVEQALAGAANARRVLLVEDDLDLAPLLTRTLERRGVEVLHAVTGEAAVELAEAAAPDLLVLDLALPEMDGFAVVERLRLSEQLRSIPLLVYTGSALGRVERERLTLGHTEFLSKTGAGPAEFENEVSRLLGLSAP